jgi:CPA1 family monovalent cation:H+ antiporter
VLAVVAAGLINGNRGPQGMSPTTRIVVFNFWEYVAFLANTFVFLLIGLSIRLTELFLYWELILWAIAAVLISRAVTASRSQSCDGWKHVLIGGPLWRHLWPWPLACQ